MKTLSIRWLALLCVSVFTACGPSAGSRSQQAAVEQAEQESRRWQQQYETEQSLRQQAETRSVSQQEARSRWQTVATFLAVAAVVLLIVGTTALRTFNQLVASKLAKGYTPGQEGPPYQHTGHEGRSTGIYPQLLEPVADTHALGHLLIDPLYCAQEKFDGKRLLVRKEGSTVTGINRRGLIVAVPESIAAEAMRLPGDCLLDGEAVGDTLHVFDVLESHGSDHRWQPYVNRLNLLRELLPATGTALMPVYTAHAAREKTGLYAWLRGQFKEGIVLKLLTAGYLPGKMSGSAAALKYKFVESASFVVTLVHPTKRSVSLGLYSGSEIVEAGHVTIPPNHDIPQPDTVVEVRATSTRSSRAGRSTSRFTWASARTSNRPSAWSAS